MFLLALVLGTPSFNFTTRDVSLRTQIEMTFQDRRVVANSCLCQQFPHVATAATHIHPRLRHTHACMEGARRCTNVQAGKAEGPAS